MQTLRPMRIAVSILAMLLVARDAAAQGGGGAGGFGGGASAAGFGAAAPTGALGGFGGFGGGGGGGGGSSQGSFGSSTIGTGASAIGQGNGQSQAPTLRSANVGFVGRESADVASFFNALGRQQQQAAQQGPGGRSRGRQPNGDEVPYPAVRVRLRVAFRPTANTTASPGIVLDRARIDRLIDRAGVLSGSISVDEGVVTLTGTAPDESARLLAERLAAIEPGVSRVENLLVVAENLPPPR